MISGQAYALVVAPKTQGGEGQFQWKVGVSDTPGAGSANDGWSNTQAMIQAGSALHPAAEFCRSLNINGYDDWYLPAQDELEILYRSFKPSSENNDTSSGTNPSSIPPRGNYTAGNPSQTDVAVFKAGGGEDFSQAVYWSSTEATYFSSWRQFFFFGTQATNDKPLRYSVRAVRRVAI